MLYQLQGVITPAARKLEMTELGGDPGAVLDFDLRGPIVGELHQLDCALDIAEQLAQIGGAGQRGQVARTQIEHPLGRFFRLVVAAELDICIGEVSVDEDVVRNLCVERLRGTQSRSELVFSEQYPDARLARLEVAGLQLQRLVQGFVGPTIETRIGGLAGAPRQCGREHGVSARVLRLGVDQPPRRGDAALGGRGRVCNLRPRRRGKQQR